MVTKLITPAAESLSNGIGREETSLIGQLETWPLQDLLLWLNKTGRNAMVRIGVGLEAGVIFVRNGHVFRCELGALQGERALFVLLSLPQGVFSLIQRDVPLPRPNVHTPTEQLLLQFAVALDERRQAASA